MIWNKQINDLFLLYALKFRNALRNGLINMSKRDYDDLGVFMPLLINLIDSEIESYHKFINSSGVFF